MSVQYSTVQYSTAWWPLPGGQPRVLLHLTGDCWRLSRIFSVVIFFTRPRGNINPGADILCRDSSSWDRRMEYWEQASPISSHTYDHARTANTLPMTTPGRLMHYLWQNIGQQHTHSFTPMTFLWGVTDYLTRQLQLIVMICARIVSSVEWTWQRQQCWMCWFSCYIKHLIMVKKKFRLVWGCPGDPAPASGSLN